MKERNNIRIYRDKHGREYRKEKYFIGGKMKFRRVYVIDGMPADEFYDKNATVIELMIDGNFHLLNDKNDAYNYDGSAFETKGREELPF